MTSMARVGLIQVAAVISKRRKTILCSKKIPAHYKQMFQRPKCTPIREEQIIDRRRVEISNLDLKVY